MDEKDTQKHRRQCDFTEMNKNEKDGKFLQNGQLFVGKAYTVLCTCKEML